MKKQTIKKYLKIYSKIRNDILEEKKYSIITFYNHKRTIMIPIWLSKVEMFLNLIADKNDFIYKQIICLSYFRGITDVKVAMEISISIATLYRIKNKIEEVLFELLILDGLVDKSDILNNLR